MDLEAALAETTPSRAQWCEWSRREPVLARLTHHDMRSQLRTGHQQRRDELLAALVRVARADPEAFVVLAGCLLPGLRRRIARYARSLERDEALAIMVGGLYEGVVAARPIDEPTRFVAGRLLSLPTERLRRAVSRQQTWAAQARHHPDTASRVDIVELSPSTLLETAVDAGVIAQHDAWLIFATRFAGRPLREAARQLGLRYEAGKKRRQRAEARWAAWWTSDGAGVPDRSGAPPAGQRAA